MCTDTPTCWYQRKVHEPMLIAILDNIIANKDTIKELVLAGDVFDTWTYPFDVQPPSISQILAAHPNIFGPNGKMGQVLDALRGAVSYMTGNHDMQTSAADLASVVSPVGEYHIQFRPNNYKPVQKESTWIDGRLIIAHGHEFCLFNKPDMSTPFAPLPVGHFVTRMISEYWSKNLRPGQTVADLPNQGNPEGLNMSNIIKNVLGGGGVSLSSALIDNVAGITQANYTAPIRMHDGSLTNLGFVKCLYTTLFEREIEANGNGTLGLTIATKSALADYDGSFLGWFAQRLAFKTGADMVVFGHTHAPIGGLEKSLVDYVNPGFLCPSIPDLEANKAFVSFIKLCMPSGRPYWNSPVQVIKVSKLPNGTFSFSSFTAPTTAITPSSTLDYSSYAQIQNLQSSALTLSSSSAFRGSFVTLPPSIPPDSERTVWVQDSVGAYGSGSTVTYRDAQNRDIVFDFECPTGIYPNTAAGGSAFTATVGDPDGYFSGTVPESGNPLFVKYVVYPGLVQGAFTASRTGRNSYAVSAAGLLPNQSVSINGRTSLGSIVQGYGVAQVYSIKMRRINGTKSFQLIIDAQGPGGWLSGFLWLYFTDQSGHRYEASICCSRRIRTVEYNSKAPAIMKIEWK